MTDKTILVVDDEDSWLARVSAAAEACGCVAITANGLNPATRLLEQQRFDLIVTDNNMGFGDEGLEFLQYLGRRFREGRIPAILHTSELPSWHEKLPQAFPWVRLVLKNQLGDDSELTAALKELLS